MFENTPTGLYYTRRGKKVRLSPEPLEIDGDDVRLPGTTWDGKPRIVKKPCYRSSSCVLKWLARHDVRYDPRYPTAWLLYFTNQSAHPSLQQAA